jgi:hypothetical protein
MGAEHMKPIPVAVLMLFMAAIGFTGGYHEGKHAADKWWQVRSSRSATMFKSPKPYVACIMVEGNFTVEEVTEACKGLPTSAIGAGADKTIITFPQIKEVPYFEGDITTSGSSDYHIGKVKAPPK